MAGRSEWQRLWDALRQFGGDPLANLGEAEAVTKSLLLSSVKEDNRQDKCVASFPNQVYGNQTSRSAGVIARSVCKGISVLGPT